MHPDLPNLESPKYWSINKGAKEGGKREEQKGKGEKSKKISVDFYAQEDW